MTSARLGGGGVDVARLLKQLGDYFTGHGAGAARRGPRDVAGRVQREANVLAYIDGFWLCFWLAMAALSLLPWSPARRRALLRRSRSVCKDVLRKCGVNVS